MIDQLCYFQSLEAHHGVSLEQSKAHHLWARTKRDKDKAKGSHCSLRGHNPNHSGPTRPSLKATVTFQPCQEGKKAFKTWAFGGHLRPKMIIEL